MTDLEDTYRRLAHHWTREQLSAHYREADRRGAQHLTASNVGDASARPIAMLATAIPPTSMLSVAIHVLHALPDGTRGALAPQLLETAARNAADALHRCHCTLELDGAEHGFAVDEWLPVVCDLATPLLESAQMHTEPPSVVVQSQQAVSWLARALVELDRDSPEAPNTLAETLARLLTICVFADAAREGAQRNV